MHTPHKTGVRYERRCASQGPGLGNSTGKRMKESQWSMTFVQYSNVYVPPLPAGHPGIPRHWIFHYNTLPQFCSLFHFVDCSSYELGQPGGGLDFCRPLLFYYNELDPEIWHGHSLGYNKELSWCTQRLFFSWINDIVLISPYRFLPLTHEKKRPLDTSRQLFLIP